MLFFELLLRINFCKKTDTAIFTKLWSQSDVKRVSFSEVAPSTGEAGPSSTSILSLAWRTQVALDKLICQLLPIQEHLDKTYR